MAVGVKGEVLEQDPEVSAEAIGIVISQGRRDEPTPLFWAYVWSSAPARADRKEKPHAA